MNKKKTLTTSLAVVSLGLVSGLGGTLVHADEDISGTLSGNTTIVVPNTPVADASTDTSSQTPSNSSDTSTDTTVIADDTSGTGISGGTSDNGTPENRNWFF